jgi:tripartite-type tricarboxylate transporter receptor subunit TctC
MLIRDPVLQELNRRVVAESGLPGFEVTQWYGVLAPVGTHPAIVSRLHKEFVSAMRSPEVNEWLVREGSMPVANTPREFAAFLLQEVARWAKVIKFSGARAD